MSAPHTNIEKQKRRHWAPLVGIGLAVAFGATMFLLWLFDVFEEAESPQDTQSEVPELLPPGSDALQDAELDDTGQAGGMPTDETQSNDAQSNQVQSDEVQSDDAGTDTTVGD